MSLGPLLTLKEASPVTNQPVLLAELVFLDNTVLYLATKPFNATEGGFAYGGNNYLCRLAQQDISAVQERSEQGIDRIPSVTLHIQDSDKTIWSNYEMASGKGFKGAVLVLRFIFWQADTANFSDDSVVPFVGVCDMPSIERQGKGDQLVVAASASRNMQRSYLPVFHIQQRCSNVMPATAAQRLAAGTDMSSPHFGCGYDPDQSGTDPQIGGDCKRGNYVTGTTPFTDCDYTRVSCIARGMFTIDSSSRRTGRFTGQEWAPQNRLTRSKSYIEGKSIDVLSGRNDAIYSERVPMLYGTQWVNPVVVNNLGDANVTNNEVIICQDDIGTDGVVQVVVNGVVIPDSQSTPDTLFRWAFLTGGTGGVHTGTRNGLTNAAALYNNLGDPYGSLAVISISYYRQLGDSASVPNVMVLAKGPKVKQANTALATDQASWPYSRTTNPAWILLDMLIWSNWRYADIDLQSFIDEAPYCDATVTYTDLTGNAGATHARFKAQFAIDKQRTAGEAIQAVLRCFNGQLVRNTTTGLLKLFIRKTLADQQPAPIGGSNYNTAISSFAADGTVVNGYAAFKFDETSVLRSNPDDPPFVRVFSDAGANTANTVQFGFQDEDNQFQSDSITILDTDGINRAGGYQGGQQVIDNLNILGISNFDQGARIARTYLAERLRGNPIGDTRGTLYFEIKTNFRVVHLNVGQICLLSWQALSIANKLVRVTKIQPSSDFEGATVTAMWHEDLWYTDAYGQQDPALFSDPALNSPNRAPYPWLPYGVQPITNDSLFWNPPLGGLPGSWWNFGIAPQYAKLTDGRFLASLQIKGCPTVNSLSQSLQAPLIGIQASTATTGGSILRNLTLFIAIVAIDADGNTSGLSRFSTVTTGPSTDTNTVTTPPIAWQAGTVAYTVFGGVSELDLSAQFAGSGTPSTVTLSSLLYQTWGPPDLLASSLNFRAKRVLQPGVFNAQCTAVGTNTISFAPPSPFTANVFAGYDLKLVAHKNLDSTDIPWAHFRVTANTTGGVFTVSPDPSGIAVAGDVFEMMFKPGTVTDTTIDDPNLVNPYSAGLVANAEVGSVLRFVAGAGRLTLRTVIANTSTQWTISQPWDTTPDSTSRFWEEESTWSPNLNTGRLVANIFTPGLVPTVASVQVSNYAGQTFIVQANIDDANGVMSLETYAPIRMVYLWGGARKQVTVTANYAASLDDQDIICDTSGGSFTVTLPVPTRVPAHDFTLIKKTTDINTVTVVSAGGGDILTESGEVSSLVIGTTVTITVRALS